MCVYAREICVLHMNVTLACVCVCVCVYIYIYIYIYARDLWTTCIYIYVYKCNFWTCGTFCFYAPHENRALQSSIERTYSTKHTHTLCSMMNNVYAKRHKRVRVQMRVAVYCETYMQRTCNAYQYSKQRTHTHHIRTRTCAGSSLFLVYKYYFLYTKYYFLYFLCTKYYFLCTKYHFLYTKILSLVYKIWFLLYGIRFLVYKKLSRNAQHTNFYYCRQAGIAGFITLHSKVRDPRWHDIIPIHT